MENDDKLADDLIAGRFKKLKSYHSDYGKKTYREIKRLAAAKPPDRKARQTDEKVDRAPEALER